jgi:large subunit ribosomal protein L19
MDLKIKQIIQESQLKKRPEVKVGDTVRLHMRIKEGEKERTQIFEGVVIQKKGAGIDATITVRKISSGIGVERIVPLHTPTMDKLEVIKRGKVRRSKLYYMRDKVGKRAMKVGNIKDVFFTDEVAVPEVVDVVPEQPTEA